MDYPITIIEGVKIYRCQSRPDPAAALMLQALLAVKCGYVAPPNHTEITTMYLQAAQLFEKYYQCNFGAGAILRALAKKTDEN
jgi:hypothetical protein